MLRITALFHVKMLITGIVPVTYILTSIQLRFMCDHCQFHTADLKGNYFMLWG